MRPSNCLRHISNKRSAKFHFIYFLRELQSTTELTHEFLGSHHSFSFPDYDQLVRQNIGQTINLTARPADLDPVSSSSLPESEMHAQIILRKVAPATPNFFHLAMTSHDDRHLGSNAITVGLDSDSSNGQRIVPSATSVEEEGGRIILIVYHDVHLAIIVEVADGHAAAGPHQLQSGPDAARKIFKGAVPVVLIEQTSFPVRRVEPVFLELRVHVPVGHENVLPAVVVKVNEPAAPAEIFYVVTKMRVEDSVGKSAVSIVPIQVRRVVGEVRL